MSASTTNKKFIGPMLAIGIVFGTAILALSVIVLIKVNSKVDGIIDNYGKPAINARASAQLSNSILSESTRIEDAMSHLNELQRIAKVFNGTRAINTSGFNATLDYITNYLTANTNFKITKTFFPVFSKDLARAPTLTSLISGNTTNHTYSSNMTIAEFYHVDYTASTNVTNLVQLTVIPNLGCSDDDWQKANPSPAGRVALVKRGDCTFIEKGVLATKYKVAALLIYNDGTAADRRQPMYITLGPNNTIPALFLSFQLGQRLANASQNRRQRVSVRIDIERRYEHPFLVGNICADTPSGDPTQTIVIGSHSDSVPAGPGINDNGSGSAANLAMAVALARLFRTSTYPKYKYRVRFCWWGAEEVGLLGSDHHVKQAKNTSIVGERLSDYLINLNYDMLGSPNYIFGIYDGSTSRNGTPSQAIPGSKKISSLFKDWFIQQNLPWDYTQFSGRSDYGPFLAEGIVAGGLFSGADDVKTVEQRDRYDHILGQGMGGIPGILEDPCYHKACDSVENINIFGYEKMVKAAAYGLESLGRQDDLRTWLYPSNEIQYLSGRSQQQSAQKYNPINAHLKLSDV
ncbi:unnamed protein product [Adineta steineri]|uniref:Peptide hydrolase n=1 Tax=Adineta steineri TaxID=433720 RepID=A0A818MFV4_9BILA|nr:unnamed protein product [Adineta steineri]